MLARLVVESMYPEGFLLAGQRVDKILAAVAAAGQEHARRVSTATLNMVSFLTARLAVKRS